MRLRYEVIVGAMAMLLAVAMAPATGNAVQAQQPAAKVEAGLRVYSSDIHDPDDGDLGGSAAIALVGTRSGVFSGKVVVSWAEAVAGLKAEIGALQGPEATIPTSAISVRYAVAWEPTGQKPPGRDILLESPPAKFSANKVPVWVTVRVPRDAAPGVYRGELRITAAGGGPLTVPVSIDVRDMTLPDTQNWRTWIEVIQSPENLAQEYSLPLWSEKHWTMIAESLRRIGETGSRVVYVPLMAHTNQGNAESMVRWIRKGGWYEYDFSIMDKYLDTAEKAMGKPKLVVLYAWDICLKVPKGEWIDKMKASDNAYQKSELVKVKAREDLEGKGPPVTVVDPSTGKTETVYLPRYEDPAGKALWQPLWTQLRQRLRQRGLDQAAMLGMITDEWPTKEEIAAINEISGGLPWAGCSHHAAYFSSQAASGKGALYEMAKVGYIAAALEFQLVLEPTAGRSCGWTNPTLLAQFWRFAYFNNQHSFSTIRHEAECMITGSERGLAHIGGDFWFSIKDNRGQRVGNIADRYPESYWHNLFIHTWLLAPGPDGPVGTARLEIFREGLQECEARIAMETALTDPALKSKLGDDLAKRAQDALDEQQRNLWRAKGAKDEDFVTYAKVPSYKTYYYEILKKWNEAEGNKWFIGSGWAERVGKLYAVGGEVQKKLGGK